MASQCAPDGFIVAYRNLRCLEVTEGSSARWAVADSLTGTSSVEMRADAELVGGPRAGLAPPAPRTSAG